MVLVGAEIQNRPSFTNISEIMGLALTLEFLEMYPLLTTPVSFQWLSTGSRIIVHRRIFANVVQGHWLSQHWRMLVAFSSQELISYNAWENPCKKQMFPPNHNTSLCNTSSDPRVVLYRFVLLASADFITPWDTFQSHVSLCT